MSELFVKTNEFLEKIKENIYLQSSIISFDNDFVDENLFEEIEFDLLHNPNDYYPLGAISEIQLIVEKEIKELNEKGVYFFYCKFKIYEKTYKDRLNKFLEKYEDADSIYFLQNELRQYLKPFESNKIYKHLDAEREKFFSYTRDRTVRFLVEQARIIGYNITINVDEFEYTMSYEIEKVEVLAGYSTSTVNGKKENKLPLWFPIGLGFAQGEIQKKIKNFSAREIVKEYKLLGYQNYITSTGIESTKDPKNIYSDLNKLKIVFVYCIENNIVMCDEFKKAYSIKLKEIS